MKCSMRPRTTTTTVSNATLYRAADDHIHGAFAVSDDEMDMDADGDDFKVAPKTMRKSYETDYRSLSQAEVEKQMREDVEYICNILGVEVCFFLLFRTFGAGPDDVFPGEHG